MASKRGKRKSVIEVARQQWPEAEIVADPVRGRELTEPRVIVRRRTSSLLGPNGEELVYATGPTLISLFTGAGGMDLGCEQAGFCCLVQCEWDESCCETLLGNRPRAFRHAALIQGDIRSVPTSLLLREAGLRVGETHLVAGGPPCQGFSMSGKRAPDDPRNDLVFEFLRVVREAKPKFFLMENVPGFTNFDKGEYLRAFLAESYGCYYELVYGLVNAVEYQVPQDRNRFLCMGTRRDLVDCDGILASLPSPLCFGRKDREYLQTTSRSTLFGLDADPLAELIMQAPGVRYFPDRPVLVPPAPVIGHDSIARTQAFLDFYRKLKREEPDRLVTSPMGDRDDF